MLKIIINGEEHEHGGDGSISALLLELGANPGRTAIMLNDEVLPKVRWAETTLAPNDQVELLVFAAGG